MYSQGLIGSGEQTTETPEFLAAFQARIDADEKIEPNDRNRRHVARGQLDHPCTDIAAQGGAIGQGAR